MTTTPADLLAIRAYLLPRTGLDANGLGIQHFSPDGGGYHEGNDLLGQAGRRDSDYSKRESPRDRPGTNDASGIDIGDFNHGGRTLHGLTVFLLARCAAGDPRCHEIREIIYSLDGVTVHRYDALGIRSTGDSSHLYHDHVSFFRDSLGRRDRADNFLGLLVEFFDGGDDMTPEEHSLLLNDAWRMDSLWSGSDKVRGGEQAGTPMWLVGAVKQLQAATAADEIRDKAALAAIQALAAGGTSVDTAAVIARINAVAEAESAAISALHDQLASAAQRESDLRERLAAALDGAVSPT
jgi:hypothetical protein